MAQQAPDREKALELAMGTEADDVLPAPVDF